MTIHVELNPEMEAQLASEAREHGVAVENYARQLMEEALAARLKRRSYPSREEFGAFLDAMARKAPDAPQLRTNTFSREMIYRDHD